MKLAYQIPFFVLTVPFEQRLIPKESGFTWDGKMKKWVTPNYRVAEKFKEYADESARYILDKISNSFALELSEEWGKIVYPADRRYLPFQEAGISYIGGTTTALLADEAGTGKTIQVAGLINNLDPVPRSVLILCPASLRLNWKRELESWLVDKSLDIILDVNPKYAINVLSYDSCWRPRFYSKLRERDWELVVMDEAHNCKNDAAKRTQAALAIAHKAKRVVFLSGTPLVNRPIELWPMLHFIMPKYFEDKYAYAFRYCGAFYQNIYAKGGRLQKVLNMDGSSNLDELQTIMRGHFMIRRLKKDVLPQLPSKRRQVIEIAPSKGDSKIVVEEARKWEKICDDLGYEKALKSLEDGSGVSFEAMAAARKEVALTKIPYAVEHISNMLENVDKVVVFCHHRAVADELHKHLPEYNPVILIGGMSDKTKQESVDKFQKDKDVRVFIGNIQAAGVGITLTAASTIIFVEINPVPGLMSQAEDRCVRIGATSDFVLIQHLVLEESLDKKLCEMVISKQKVSEKTLDR